MKFAPVVFLLAFALCTSCATSPPAGAPAVPAVPAAAAARARELGASARGRWKPGIMPGRGRGGGGRCTWTRSMRRPGSPSGWPQCGWDSRTGRGSLTNARWRCTGRARAGKRPRWRARLIRKCSCSPYLGRYGEAEALLETRPRGFSNRPAAFQSRHPLHRYAEEPGKDGK